MSCRARAREGWLYLFTVKRCGMSCARAREANLCKYLQRLSMSCRVRACDLSANSPESAGAIAFAEFCESKTP